MQVIEEGRQEGGRLLREWGLSWGSWGGEVGGEGGGGQKKKKNFDFFLKFFFFFFFFDPPPPPGPPPDSRSWITIQHMKQIQYNATTRKEILRTICYCNWQSINKKDMYTKEATLQTP